MKIPWSGNQCIICIQHRPLSDEHVIPRSLGGDLTCDFVCKPCNDSFGSTFEASAKADPAIRLAAAHLRATFRLTNVKEMVPQKRNQA